MDEHIRSISHQNLDFESAKDMPRALTTTVLSGLGFRYTYEAADKECRCTDGVTVTG